MKSIFLIFLFASWSITGFTQSPTGWVNPDGTPSEIHDHEDSGILINPDGSLSIVISHGCPSLVLTPDGDLSMVQIIGGMAIPLFSDETDSTVDNERNADTQGIPNSFNPYANITIRDKRKGYKRIIIQDSNTAVKRVFYIKKADFRRMKKEFQLEKRRKL